MQVDSNKVGNLWLSVWIIVGTQKDTLDLQNETKKEIFDFRSRNSNCYPLRTGFHLFCRVLSQFTSLL